MKNLQWQKGKRKKEGCQVDLLIDRSDGIIDLCEMKYHEGKFTISESYQEDLNNRKNIFKEASKTQKPCIISWSQPMALHTMPIPRKYRMKCA